MARTSSPELSAEFLEAEKGAVLRWIQPVAGNRYHELRSEDGVHAILKWKGMYGSLAYVHTSEGTFTLKRAGFLVPRVTVRLPKKTKDLGRFDVGIGITGDFAILDGPSFEIKRRNMARRRWTVVNRDGERLVTIEKVRNPKFAARVTMLVDARSVRYLMLACAIVWYSFILSMEEWEPEPKGYQGGGNG